MVSFALVSLCVCVLLSALIQLTQNQSTMFKQNRALNIAQRAIAEAWNTGSCYQAKNLAQGEGMTLMCSKVSYGAHIELEWHSSYGRVQRIDIN